jgi:hypothetical protein
LYRQRHNGDGRIADAGEQCPFGHCGTVLPRSCTFMLQPSAMRRDCRC